MGHTTQRAPGKVRLDKESDSGGNAYARRKTRLKNTTNENMGPNRTKSIHRGSRPTVPSALKSPIAAAIEPSFTAILVARWRRSDTISADCG